MKTGVMAVDQYGNTEHDLGNHPRKELLKRLGATRADKIYTDTASGPKHVGYVIHGKWFRLYRVEAWESLCVPLLVKQALEKLRRESKK